MLLMIVPLRRNPAVLETATDPTTLLLATVQLQGLHDQIQEQHTLVPEVLRKACGFCMRQHKQHLM